MAAALEASGHDLPNVGTFSTDPVDHPDYARAVEQAVLRGFVDEGVLICGSGAGASIAANKIRGVRASLCHDPEAARLAREEDNANVLCLGAREVDVVSGVTTASAWLAASFSGEDRFVHKVSKVALLEGGRAPTADTGSRLQDLRTLLRDLLKLATTVAFGRRYLQSTGQLHKGGRPNGVFIQLTGEDKEDMAIPGAGHGFSTLKGAQALGDLQALRDAGRRVVRVHLTGKQTHWVEQLIPVLQTAIKKP